MPITQPDFIPVPWAENGNKQDPIDKDTPPAVGRATWDLGFPPVTAEQESNGGIPPNRLDFQGVLYALSAHLFFGQSGNLYAWSNTLDYNAGAHVLGSDGNEYIALANNGVSSTVVNPTTDVSYAAWKPLTMFMTDYVYPVGSVYMTTSNANPGTLFGGTWVKIEDRFLLGSGSTRVAGTTGGATTYTLTAQNLPQHLHSVSITTNSSGAHTHSLSGSTSSAGAHTHTRGSMNITGSFGGFDVQAGAWGSGAFSVSKNGNYNDYGGKWQGSYANSFNLNAANSWSGSTSSAGAHTHTISGTANSAGNHTHSVIGNTGNTGGNTPFSIMPSYYVVNIWRRTA